MDPATVRYHTLRLCITELAIWAVSCHIQYDFPLEMGISDLLFHHLHQHLYLYLYLYLLLCLHRNLSPKKYPRQNQNLHFGLGINVTFQDVQCCRKLPHLVHEIIAFTAVKWACTIKWYRATTCLIHIQRAMSERGNRYETQIERQRNEHTQAVRDGRIVCESRATTDICSMQWWWSSSHLCGGGGKVGRGREGGSSQVSRSLQYATPKRETRLTPCTRAPGLWDASVEKEPCRYS